QPAPDGCRSAATGVVDAHGRMIPRGRMLTAEAAMRTLIVVVGLAGLGVVTAAQDARSTLTVGTASAERGKVAYGELQVPQGSDAGTSLPVAVIHGARPGKTVAFIAGSHGTEYASTVALTRLIARIDPATLSGSVIV